jgi:ADP-ribosylglycohydrolase
MSANRETLNRLFENGGIDLRRGSLFDTTPPPLPPGLTWSRIEGMMLGLAIGDGLGITSEGQLPHDRRARHGELRDYIPNRHDPRPMGFPSDDTQLAFRTLDQINLDRGLNPGRLAERFCRDHIIGIGSAVKGFVRAFKSGTPWDRAGQPSAGNGALMRIAPILIPHLRSGTPDLWVDTALCAMVTHNDTASITACLAFVNILWQLLGMKSPPDPEWWLRAFVDVARDLETDRPYIPRGGSFMDYSGPLSQFVEDKVGWAYAQGLPVVEACDRWHSGAYLLETVPCVIYILMRHGHEPEEAIVRAVNDTKDNDTVAAIVGAAVGALHGRDKIPARWVANLSGRTTHEDGGDDGRVFAILEEARTIWWRA